VNAAHKALIAALAVTLICARSAFAQAPPQALTGTLLVVWGDPDPRLGIGGETRYELATPGGIRVPLRIDAAQSGAVRNFRKLVTVNGRYAVTQQPGTVNQDTFVVDGITTNGDVVSLPPPAPTSGTKRVVFLLVRFSDDSDVPHAPSFYTDLNNPDTPPPGAQFPTTINGFFKKTSYGAFGWDGYVAGAGGLGAPQGWLTLPHPSSYYLQSPCDPAAACGAKTFELGDDATALGRAAGVDFRNFDTINFVLSNDLGCCAYGGSYYSAADGKSYGATWAPPWAQDATFYAHELGHSLGLPHSGWVYFAYDSPWDSMSRSASAAFIPCGSYFSAESDNVIELNCREPGDGYIAAHKDFLGWIPTANQLVIDGPYEGTVSLEANSLPLSSAVKMIKVCLAGLPCTGSSAHYLTVEARVKGLGTTSQFDNSIPDDGVIIHDVQMDRHPIEGPCFWNSQSGWAQPIDSTPGDYDSVNCTSQPFSYPNALDNAQWAQGQTYTAAAYGLTISVLARTTTTFVVSVSSGGWPSILENPTSQTITAGQSATLTVAAKGAVPLTYQWFRGESGNVAIPIAGATSTSYSTPALTSTTRYWVRVSNAKGSADSSSAVVFVAFTDDPLISNVTPMKVIHITELRQRIDALRVRFRLTPFAWTDAVLVAGSTPIRAAHLTELRTGLAQAYVAATVSPPIFSDAAPEIATTVIRALHFEELRTSVHLLEQR
jgi:hypothetical protein